MIDQSKKNFIWNFIGITFNTLNSFLFSIIANRINGMEIAGMFAYGYAIACLLWIVSIFFNRVFQVSNLEIKDKTFIKSRYITCFIMFILSIAIAFVSSNNITKIIIIILLCLFRNIEAVSDIYYGIFQKNDKLDYVGKSMFIKAILGIIILTIVDYLTKDIIASIVGLLIVNVIGTFVDIYMCQKYIRENKDKSKSEDIIKIFKLALPIFLFSFLSIGLVNMQKYFIGFLETEEIQDIFNIIIMPATIMSLCGQYLAIPFMKTLNDSFIKKEYDKFDKVNIKIMLILFAVGVIATICIYFIGISVLEIIYKVPLKEYSIGICAIVIISIFYALTAILSTSLTIMKKNSQQLIIYAIVTTIAAISSFILIKKFSINGAVISYCSSLAVQFIMYLGYYKYSLKKIKGN
ncbi:MAG: oligosaccharide flippase family protein [Clostridia bacterium]|nr:oligosaccharide flippase family protein [Clostridia bacterium]